MSNIKISVSATSDNNEVYMKCSFLCDLSFKVIEELIHGISTNIGYATFMSNKGTTLNIFRHFNEKNVSFGVLCMTETELLHLATSIIEIENEIKDVHNKCKEYERDIIGTLHAEEKSRTQSSKKFSDERQIGKYSEEIVDENTQLHDATV